MHFVIFVHLLAIKFILNHFIDLLYSSGDVLHIYLIYSVINVHEITFQLDTLFDAS